MATTGRRHFFREAAVSGWVWFRGIVDSVGRLLFLLAVFGVSTGAVAWKNHSLWALLVGIVVVAIVCLAEGAYRVWRDATSSLMATTVSQPIRVDIPVTLNGLRSGESRASAAVKLTHALAVASMKLWVRVNFPDRPLGDDRVLYVLVYESPDGENFPGGLTGTDEPYVMSEGATGFRPGGFVAPDPGTQQIYGPHELTYSFGGGISDAWGLIFQNKTGQDLEPDGNEAWCIVMAAPVTP